MTETTFDRRSLLVAGLVATSAVSAGSAAAQGAAPPTPFAPQPKPLPFDPKAVPGLSEKMLVSHHDNNYAGAVKRIPAIRADIAKLDLATAPGFQLNGLKREELIAWNSMILHEIYFAGLGPKTAPSPALGRAIERDFGSHAQWAGEFAAIGKALGGGSGWVLLTWSPHDGRLINTWAADHTMTLAGGAPLLALDMYEHAYAMDYGAKAAGYVDAVMAALSFGYANEAFRKAGGA